MVFRNIATLAFYVQDYYLIAMIATLAFYVQDYYRESDRMIVGVQIELSAILSMKLV